MIWFKSKREPLVDPEELTQKAEESMRQTASQQEHVNVLTSYLNWRNGRNGFGDDFEFTLSLKEAK